MNNKNNFACCFVNTDQYPLNIKHICYYTEKIEGSKGVPTYFLWEVVEETYPHPDGPQNASISLITTHLVKKFKEYEQNAAAAVVLLHAQNNTREMVKVFQSK